MLWALRAQRAEPAGRASAGSGACLSSLSAGSGACLSSLPGADTEPGHRWAPTQEGEQRRSDRPERWQPDRLGGKVTEEPCASGLDPYLAIPTTVHPGDTHPRPGPRPGPLLPSPEAQPLPADPNSRLASHSQLLVFSRQNGAGLCMPPTLSQPSLMGPTGSAGGHSDQC